MIWFYQLKQCDIDSEKTFDAVIFINISVDRKTMKGQETESMETEIEKRREKGEDRK